MSKCKLFTFANGCIHFLLALMITTIVVAQSDNGTINGSIADPSGARIAGAAVTIKNQFTGAERTAQSNSDGLYSITNIPSGTYTLTVIAVGFKTFESTNNKLDPSSTLEVNAPLQVGSAKETVEVVASATQLQTETASVQKLVTRQQIDALELNGRNPIGLASLFREPTAATSLPSRSTSTKGLETSTDRGTRKT